MFRIRLANQMLTTQVELLVPNLVIADSLLISLDTMVIHAFCPRRSKIYHGLRDHNNCPSVPFHCKLASRWQCHRVNLYLQLRFILIPC